MTSVSPTIDIVIVVGVNLCEGSFWERVRNAEKGEKECLFREVDLALCIFRLRVTRLEEWSA